MLLPCFLWPLGFDFFRWMQGPPGNLDAVMLGSAAVSAQGMAIVGLAELGLTIAVLGSHGMQERRVARRRVSLTEVDRDAVPVAIFDRDASHRHFIGAGGGASLASAKPAFTAPARA